MEMIFIKLQKLWGKCIGVDVQLRYYTRGIIPLYCISLCIVHCIIQHRLNCGPYLRIVTMVPWQVACLHCTRILQGQAGVSAITRRPNAFIVAHELGRAITRPGPPFSIWIYCMIKSLQRGLQSSASAALKADMKVNLKRTSLYKISRSLTIAVSEIKWNIIRLLFMSVKSCEYCKNLVTHVNHW